MNAPHRATTAALVLALAVAAATPSSAPGSRGVAVLELFTSEGCSSCPPADALLERLVHDADSSGRRVYGLSLHVDYWDQLGWRDPYSSAAITRRQSQYKRRFGLSSMYTPEMVVNGEAECVGSNAGAVEKQIERALARPSEVMPQLSVSTAGQDVRVRCDVAGAPKGATLNVAWVQSRAESAPNDGENGGRRLHHVNVVLDLHTIQLSSRLDSVVVLHRPRPEDGHVIGWVQAADLGPVLGAAALSVPAPQARR